MYPFILDERSLKKSVCEIILIALNPLHFLSECNHTLGLINTPNRTTCERIPKNNTRREPLDRQNWKLEQVYPVAVRISLSGGAINERAKYTKNHQLCHWANHEVNVNRVAEQTLRSDDCGTLSSHETICPEVHAHQKMPRCRCRCRWRVHYTKHSTLYAYSNIPRRTSAKHP